jgi:hypothetical protein
MSISFVSRDIAAVKSDDTAPLYGRDAYGYGGKIPTRHWVRLAGESRWRRVYVMQYGNAGSPFIVQDGEDVFLRECDLF